MSLLKKFVASAPKNETEEIVDCIVINVVGAAPVIVNDVPKARLRATIILEDTKFDAYIFAEAVIGAPEYIPSTGCAGRATLRAVMGKDKDGKDKEYINVVHLGVKA